MNSTVLLSLLAISFIYLALLALQLLFSLAKMIILFSCLVKLQLISNHSVLPVHVITLHTCYCPNLS